MAKNKVEKRNDGSRKFLGVSGNKPTRKLDLIPWKDGRIAITLDCSEFTSHCPVTGQPDFAKLKITYIPREVIAETKSVKLYMWRFRKMGKFNERIIAEICKDFAAQLKPHFIRVEGSFAQRGGISVHPVMQIGSPL